MFESRHQSELFGLRIVLRLCFGGRDVADGFEQAAVVEPHMRGNKIRSNTVSFLMHHTESVLRHNVLPFGGDPPPLHRLSIMRWSQKIGQAVKVYSTG